MQPGGSLLRFTQIAIAAGVEIRSRIKGRCLDGDELFPASGGACGANPATRLAQAITIISWVIFSVRRSALNPVL